MPYLRWEYWIILWIMIFGFLIRSEYRRARVTESRMLPASGLPIRKFFNTSGLKYRELNLKEKMETATREELLSVLASDGKLVKRPLLVAADFVLVGFDETAWRQRLAVR